MTNITNEAIVYSRAVAYQLRLQGFKIIRVGVNPSCPQNECYYFNNTPELQQALQAAVELIREAKQND